jgi:hypothetical protein
MTLSFSQRNNFRLFELSAGQAVETDRPVLFRLGRGPLLEALLKLRRLFSSRASGWLDVKVDISSEYRTNPGSGKALEYNVSSDAREGHLADGSSGKGNATAIDVGLVRDVPVKNWSMLAFSCLVAC